jgi:O-acetyl-ADP-ribose deacetylase
LTTIEVVQGDITDQDTDAIVNAANNHFWMGAGVAGAIKRRGGAQIEADAMRQGPVDPGDCVITSGRELAATYVIHAAVMGQDLETSAPIIERATRGALSMADSHGVTSIAFPAFGTGVGGFPIDECARIMIAAVRAHEPKSLRLVRFVLFGQPAYDTFVAVARGSGQP